MPIEINIYLFILKEQALQKLKYMLFERKIGNMPAKTFQREVYCYIFYYSFLLQD